MMHPDSRSHDRYQRASRRGRIAAICLALSWPCLASATLAADAPTGGPTIASIENQIELVQQNSNLTDVQKERAVESLNLAKTRLEAAADLNQQALRYAEALTSAPLRRAAFEAQATRLEDAEPSTGLADAPLLELEAALNQALSELTGLTSRSAQIDADLARERSFDVQAALEQARKPEPITRLAPDVSAISNDANVTLAAAARMLQQNRIGMLEQRLVSRGPRLSVLEAEKGLLQEQITAAENRVVRLRSWIADHRQSDAARTAAEARQTMAALSGEPQVIRDLAADIVERADELLAIVAEHDVVIQRKDDLVRQTQQMESRARSLLSQLEIAQLGSSPEFGAALRELRDQLIAAQSSDEAIGDREQALTRSRLAQFRIDAQRDRNEETGSVELMASIRSETGAPVPDEQATIVARLIEQRDALLDKLSQAYASQIEDLTELIAQDQASAAQSREYARELDEHLLWMPSAPAMNLNVLAVLGTSFAWLVDPAKWQGVLKTALARITGYPLLTLLVGLLILVFLIRRRRLIAILADMKNKVGDVERDRLTLTFTALLVTIALAVPGPLALLLASGVLAGPGSFSGVVASAFVDSASVFLIVEFILQCVRNNGLAELHLRWDPQRLAALKGNLRWFGLLFIPAIWVNIIVDAWGTAEIRDSLGRVTFIAAMLVLASFIFRVFAPDRQSFTRVVSVLDRGAAINWRKLGFVLMFAVPAGVAGLSVIGYHYTAVRLGTYFIETAIVLFFGYFLYSLTLRAFYISHRRLAHERALERAESDTSPDKPVQMIGEGPSDLLDEQEKMDLRIVEEQTRALLKTVVLVSVGIVLFNIWSEFMPAFQPLENVKLWNINETIDGAQVTVAITLLDLLLAFGVGVVTFLAAKNIPGLLEITLLRRMTLLPGTSYAVTTMTRYIIVIAGSVAALQLLGAQWSKLQWLVAALSVGLGFGLQEIVANFVSGIVILFERPIRIGDTVTVGDQSGTVSKIRIRATTILNWDRREIIIPNKTFITERLVNWTLSDAISRTTISVGVAYGSDVALAEKLLLEIATNNAQVLSEPPPAALFRGFGDSSLNFELRVFVAGISDLVPVGHQLHREIDRVFREHDIEIAFPQRDVHLDSRPIEVKLLKPGKEDESS